MTCKDKCMCDTWQAMCHKACKGKCMCDTSHMHVNGEVYKRGGKSVRRGGEQQKGKEGKKRLKEKKGKEKEGEKKSVFRRSELEGPRSKVYIFDKGYTPRGRDFSYFGLFSTIRVVGLCLCPKELFGRISKYGNAVIF